MVASQPHKLEVAGSNPASAPIKTYTANCLTARLAHLVERLYFKQKVIGSTPIFCPRHKCLVIKLSGRVAQLVVAED